MLKNFFKFGKKKKDEEQKNTLENEIEKEIKKLGNGSKSKLLVIGRKNGRER